MRDKTYSLGDAFDYFRAHSHLSPRSLETYAYAKQHFFTFLETSPLARPLSIAGPAPETRALSALGSHEEDVEILLWFINHLAESVKKDRLGASTVRLYTHAMISWFAFMVDEMLLPDGFPAALAISRAKRRLAGKFPQTSSQGDPPEPPKGIEDLIHAFDFPQLDADRPPKEQHRQRVEALRNRALLYALASSGGRISEVLRLQAKDVRGAQVGDAGIWSAVVRGKGRGAGGRKVTLRFTPPALLAMQEYLEARQDPGARELFVSHAWNRPKARGKPLSPNSAWYMVRKTARDLGLPAIHPHDFRHWRATQMLRQGIPIDQVQGYLNHRSIRTTQLYAKTAHQAIDEAGARTDPI
ncbi:MAG: tyrosine-type recombinase/integrase [Anaerolineales bacterium]